MQYMRFGVSPFIRYVPQPLWPNVGKNDQHNDRSWLSGSLDEKSRIWGDHTFFRYCPFIIIRPAGNYVRDRLGLISPPHVHKRRYMIMNIKMSHVATLLIYNMRTLENKIMILHGYNLLIILKNFSIKVEFSCKMADSVL